MLMYDVDTYRDQIKSQLDTGFTSLSLTKPFVVARSFPDGANALEEMEHDAKKYSNANVVIFITFITQNFGAHKLTPGSYDTTCGYRIFIYGSNDRDDELILDYYKAARDILHANRYKLVRGFSNPVRISRGGLFVSVIDFEVKLPYAGV